MFHDNGSFLLALFGETARIHAATGLLDRGAIPQAERDQRKATALA